MDLDETLKALKKMQTQAHDLHDKYYFRWTELSAKEFPYYDKDGNYIIYKERKPSAQLKKANENYCAVYSFKCRLEQAIFDFENMVKVLKE